MGRKGVDLEEQEGLQRRGARLGTCIKMSNSARDVGSKAEPGFASQKLQEFCGVGFNIFISLLLGIVSLPGLSDPSVTKQRLSWHQCASSSDFWELWVKAFMRNLELSCAFAAHFPELSSLHFMCN